MSQVSQKYLKDEDGNIISPVTSISSVYYNNTSLLDVLFYKAGETETIGAQVNSQSGYISSASQNLYVTVTTPKRLDNIKSITITGGTLTVRRYKWLCGQ